MFGGVRVQRRSVTFQRYSAGQGHCGFALRGGLGKGVYNIANPQKNSLPGLLTNEQITCAEVRALIGNEKKELGIMKRAEAQAIADEKNVDLVLIAPQGNPPVVHIIDYGKLRFEQSKKEKEMRKLQKQAVLKEVRLSLNIDDNDLKTKLGHAREFLENGDKVKVTVRFKGREITHGFLGENLMKRVAELCADLGTPDKTPKLEGRNLTMIILPIKGKKQ